MEKKKYCVYMYTNKINNKKYIGITCQSLVGRAGANGQKYNHCTKFYNAILKYGWDNFKSQILEDNLTQTEAREKEQYYIAFYDTMKNGYNLTTGGEEHKKYSQETKERLSNYAKNIRNNDVYRTEEFRQTMSSVTSGEKNGMYGKHHTEETKKKISENRKGLATGEKNGMYGKSGVNAINGKWIGQYNEEKVLIKIWHSKKAVLEYLGLKGHTNLDIAIKNFTMYKGYYWKLEEKNGK